ncbi:hypothetical protein [Kitasatospora sp. NPDC088134]|uniref:hypothetical protein n=1 Tax=Kitasatospora sp. NPDC088134 TaxID=3364071 RepID=UPI0037FB1368
MAAAEELTVWAITCGQHGSVGIRLLAPEAPAGLVLQHHRELVGAERGHGVVPELDRLAVVRSEADVIALGDAVDFLDPVVGRFTAERSPNSVPGWPAFAVRRGRSMPAALGRRPPGCLCGSLQESCADGWRVMG